MKRLKVMLLSILTVLMMSVSCSKIDSSYYNFSNPTNNKGEYAILFNNQSSTKATVNPTSSKGYDEFSLYTWNSNDEVIMNPYTVQVDGADSYTYEGIGNQTLQYFKNNANSYSFIGLIPTTTSTLNNGSVTVGVESFVVDDKKAEDNGVIADSPKEFLYARTDVNKEDYNKTVTLPFKHGNALLYLGFISDDANTEVINYTPEIPWRAGMPGTKTTLTEKRKMFDLMAEGKSVGYPFTSSQESMGGYYTGQKGNFFNLRPNENYISQERLAVLAPLVNAQFVYTDEDGNIIDDDWIYGVDRKNKVFIAFANGVSSSEFIAGNDAFWTNLTNEEKAALQNYKDSGCRAIRINRSSDGNYYVWGESYGLFMDTTAKYFTIIYGDTVPSVTGIRVFSAQSDPTDGYAHLAHTTTADATVSTSLVFANRVTSSDVIPFSLPGVTIPVGTTEGDAVYSPTTFYSIPGDSGLTNFVVKISYTYKGTTVYDVRVPITLPSSGLESGKYYKYIINIKSISNGTNDPLEAYDEKNDIDITNSPILVTVDVTDYNNGHTQIITI